MLKAWNKGYPRQIRQGVKANIMNNGIYWQRRERIQPRRFECAGSMTLNSLVSQKNLAVGVAVMDLA